MSISHSWSGILHTILKDAHPEINTYTKSNLRGIRSESKQNAGQKSVLVHARAPGAQSFFVNNSVLCFPSRLVYEESTHKGKAKAVERSCCIPR